MKVYRLLSILTTLLNNDLVSAKDLAEKNEVSIKTIQRDGVSSCNTKARYMK